MADVLAYEYQRYRTLQSFGHPLPMNVVKELMGHSRIETTAKFYNQVTDEHRRAAQERGQELLTRTMSDHKMTISGI